MLQLDEFPEVKSTARIVRTWNVLFKNCQGPIQRADLPDIADLFEKDMASTEMICIITGALSNNKVPFKMKFRFGIQLKEVNFIR